MNFQKEALTIARKSITEYLSKRKSTISEFVHPRFQENCGVFVTLKKSGELRGCIGFVRGVHPLGESLKEMAIAAATKDSRFNPVTLNELNEIDIEISVLTPMIEVNDISEIEIGKDGLMLISGFNSGLLLPQVATEWHWDITEFLHHLCLKAGLPPGSYKMPGAKLLKFSADVFGEKKS